MPKPNHPGDCPDEVRDQDAAGAATRAVLEQLEAVYAADRPAREALTLQALQDTIANLGPKPEPAKVAITAEDFELLKRSPGLFAREFFADGFDVQPWQERMIDRLAGAARVLIVSSPALPPGVAVLFKDRPWALAPAAAEASIDFERERLAWYFRMPIPPIANWNAIIAGMGDGGYSVGFESRAKRRRRVRFEVRDAILSRRLGLRPSVWRGK